MEIKRYVIEFASDEKKNVKCWIQPDKYPIFCRYLDYLVKDYKKGFYTHYDAIKLIYNAFGDLQSMKWKF